LGEIALHDGFILSFMVSVLIAQPFSTTGPCPAMPPKEDEETDEAGVNPIYISQIALYICTYNHTYI